MLRNFIDSQWFISQFEDDVSFCKNWQLTQLLHEIHRNLQDHYLISMSIWDQLQSKPFQFESGCCLVFSSAKLTDGSLMKFRVTQVISYKSYGCTRIQWRKFCLSSLQELFPLLPLYDLYWLRSEIILTSWLKTWA
jgi:hypothetical protein